MALYFIKGTTLTSIADAIRSKTGNSASVPVADMASQILGITGGGSSDTVVFEEQNLNFSLDSSMGFFGAWGEGMFTLEDGKEYIVTWDGTEHRCTAYSGEYLGAGKTAYFLGNKEFLEAFVQGQTINPKEPFVIYQLLSNGYNGVMTFSNEASHRVGIRKAPASGGDHTITFMSEDGSTVLYEKPIMHGDTSGDVIALGLFSTPIKESTAQYHYTFNGWSLTAGGEADSNALAHITEDRTVYVVFEATVRKYTANFYDGDTLLKTEQVEYGTNATPPDMSNSALPLLGWIPRDLLITGDTDFVAEFTEDTAEFPLQTITTVYNSSTYMYEWSKTPTPFADNAAGDIYEISWDGTNYECTSRSLKAVNASGGRSTKVMVGNPKLLTRTSNTVTSWTWVDTGEAATDNGLPFFIELCNWQSQLYVISKTRGNHTLRIDRIS